MEQKLQTDEVLIALSATAAQNKDAALALSRLPLLKGCQIYSSVMLSATDKRLLRKLECDVTSEPRFQA